MKVEFLMWNWGIQGNQQDGLNEGYACARVGQSNTYSSHGKVISITEQIPHAEGMRWNYLIEYEDGTRKRIFNPNEVEYEKGK